jgi:hypothetical protein
MLLARDAAIHRFRLRSHSYLYDQRSRLRRSAGHSNGDRRSQLWISAAGGVLGVVAQLDVSFSDRRGRRARGVPGYIRINPLAFGKRGSDASNCVAPASKVLSRDNQRINSGGEQGFLSVGPPAIWEAHTKPYPNRQLEAPCERLREESRDKDEAPLFQANAEKKHSGT